MRPDTTELSPNRLVEVLTNLSGRLINSKWRNPVVDLLKLSFLDSSAEAGSCLARRWNVFVGKDGHPAGNLALYGLMMSALANTQRDFFSPVSVLSVDEYLFIFGS
jgi:hypothetical protein